jgi:tetratricopeptide (TPR) repeat protein
MAEKSVSELPRDLRALYTKGNDALARENYDYALDLYNTVLAKEPAVFECRKALRNAQQRKASGASGFFKKMLNTASASPQVAKGQLALRRDPAEALQIAEQILNNDPFNSGAHRIVLEAATTLEMPQTAVLSLEILVRNSPKDKQIAIDFASALADTGGVVRAEQMLSELYALHPNDPELGQALKNISARKTMDKGGYEALSDGSGSYRDILRNKEEATALEQDNRQVKSEDRTEVLLKEYERRIVTEPENVKIHRSLAEMYTERKQFDKALEVYEKMKTTAAGADPSLDRSIADTTLKRLDHQITLLDPTAPDYADSVARMEAEKQTYQLGECQKRAERFPTDLQIRFELGVLYFKAGKISEAIQEFQKAQNNPNRKIQAMSYLGQCFAKRNMNDMAARKLQEAIKEKVVFDDEKKEIIYVLGCVLEKMGKQEEAIEQFEIIYERDIGYKDVAAKVDKYHQG